MNTFETANAAFAPAGIAERWSVPLKNTSILREAWDHRDLVGICKVKEEGVRDQLGRIRITPNDASSKMQDWSISNDPEHNDHANWRK